MTELPKTYRERLQWAMTEARKTNQSALAREIGIKPQSIQHLLDADKNAQGSSHTPALAMALGVSPQWLATGEGSPRVFIIDGQHRLFGALSAHGLDRAVVTGPQSSDQLPAPELSVRSALEIVASALAGVPEPARDGVSRKLASLALAPDSRDLLGSLASVLGAQVLEKPLGAPIAPEHQSTLDQLSKEAETKHGQSQQRRRSTKR